MKARCSWAQGLAAKHKHTISNKNCFHLSWEAGTIGLIKIKRRGPAVLERFSHAT